MSKRRGIIYSVLLFSLMLVSCDNGVPSYSLPELEEPVVLDLFALNDLHGSIDYNNESSIEYGMYKIGSYLRDMADKNPGGTINMDAGDIWQGSADSNITRGKVLVEMFNSLDWAASTLGNHEFDWYDTIIEENRALANYPILGANVMDKKTNKRAENITDGASTMIQRKGVNIGIIGTTGSSLESSILASAVAPYSFEPVTKYVIEEANKLRAQGAHLIILLTHDSLTGYHSSSEYGGILEPKGRDPYVDVVFTGHEHALDRQIINGVPVLQTNGNGRQVMHVNLTVSNEDVVINTYEHVSTALSTYPNDPIITEVYARYSDQISTVKDEVVGSLSTSINNKTPLVNLATRSMLEEAQKTFNADIAIHNTGGVRVYSMPSGPVTYGDIYKAFPFDNTVVVVKDVWGSDVSRAMSGNGYYYREGLTGIDYDKKYTVVTINYISESNYNNLKNYPQSVLEGVFVRDLVAQFFREHKTVNPSEI